MPVTTTSALRPLTDVVPGDQFMVVEFVSNIVRHMCPSIAIAPSDVLTCVARTTRDLTLRTASGSNIVIDRFYAAFIAVRLLHDDGPAQPRPRRSSERVPDAVPM